MNQDEIIRMARESGFEIGSVTSAIYAPTSCEMELTRFAALVAAAEREECAKVCEETRIVKGGEVFSAKIRARGNT